MLWSLSGCLFRSGLFAPQMIAKVTPCAAIWMLIQLHYFVSSFYRSERIKIPWAYIFLVGTITLAVLGYIPQNIEVIASGISVDHGPWTIAVFSLFLVTAGVKDIYSLTQKYRLSPNPAERNQIVYLFAAVVIIVVFLSISIPRGGELATLSLPVS